MLERRAPERPERILESFRESYVALAAQDDVNMLKARTRQPEVIQPVIQLDAADTHGKIPHLGKIR